MPPQPPPAGALLNKSVLWNDEWRSSVGSKPRPLWVLPPGSHDGPADTYQVKWSERGGGYSHNYVDAEDVRDDDEAVARAARAQDVEAAGPPAAAAPLNQGLRLLEAAGSHTVVVKKERDEAKEDAEEQEELAGKLVQSENAKMTKIDELKTAAASKDARIGELETELSSNATRIGELEASLQAKDETIAELRGRVAELEKSGPKKAAKTKKPAASRPPATKKRKAAPPAKKPATKKTKTKKTDETCPLSSVSWTVTVRDEELLTYDKEREYYESKGQPICNQTLEIEAPPTGAKWFTLREEDSHAEFGPSFDFKDGRGFNYDIHEDGWFSYSEAMKIIREDEASGKNGPHMIDWFSVAGYYTRFELRKASAEGALQFRFVDAQVEIRSPKGYDEDAYFPSPMRR